MKKIKLGFIGVGFMGQLAHIKNYDQLRDECEIVAIAEARRSLGEAVASRYGVKTMLTDHRDLLQIRELDAVVAIQPFGNHINIVPDVLNAGLPLLTEKPLCITVENGAELVACAERNHTLHMVGYHKRSDPAVEYARSVIADWKASGEFGCMRLVRISMPPGNWVGGAPDMIRTGEEFRPEKLEAGPAGFSPRMADEYVAFVNYYIHQVNMLRFLLGEPYRVTYADASGVLMAVESAGGVCGTLEMAAYSNTIAWQETLFVGFEKGTVQVELPPPLASQQAGRVTVMKDNGKGMPETVCPHMPMLDAMKNQARNFLAAVRKERPAPCDSREALEDLKVAADYIRLRFGS